METIIDEEKKVKHDTLATNVESVFDDLSKIKVQLSAADVESCYMPIIQSGGQYDLRPNAQSSSSLIKYDVIMCSLGARYKGYCSNIARTFFIDPTKSMEAAYEILRQAHELCVSSLRPGVKVDSVVHKVRKFVESNDPKLLPHLTKNLGFGLGLEFRESTNNLSGKNSNIVQEGMAFNVAIGLDNIPNKLTKTEAKRSNKHLETYSIFIADTVAVLKEENKVYTKVSKSWSKIRYDIDDAGKEEASPAKKKKKPASDSIHGPVDTSISGTRNQLLQSRLRDQQRQLEGKETDHERRERHQAELMVRKREEAMRRLEEKDKQDDPTEEKVKKIQSYRSAVDFPKNANEKQVFVDMRSESILVPINGIPTPFHISTIKNVSKSEEDKATYLRINFYTPGLSLGRDCSPAMQAMLQQHDKKLFIKELGFRSVDALNLNMNYRMIKELQKRVKQRQQLQQEKSDLVVQEDLILTKDRRVPRLSDLTARPPLSGRKTQGVLEAHANGLRFKSLKNERLDILYSNIKHAIFQPCDQELVVLVHFHLKNHIMIGKKKFRDVQFFTEVMESSQNLDNRRRSMYDPDELDEENRERQLRSKLNQTFKEFCRKVETTIERAQFSITFDIPYRELGFQGTPHKEMILLQPTVNCLVNLTEHPFFIVSLSEIEHVHFERVMFTSKNFDLVILLKNFDLPPFRISAIPMADLESLKEWLDDIDLCFTTGTANLNWKTIMQTIKQDERFYLDTDEDGMSKPAGWEFLKMEGSDDDDDDEEDQESNFSLSDVESDAESESDSSDASSDASVDEEDSSDFSGEDIDEEAPSWEELEREATAEERLKGKRKSNDDGSYSSSKKKKKSRR